MSGNQQIRVDGDAKGLLVSLGDHNYNVINNNTYIYVDKQSLSGLPPEIIKKLRGTDNPEIKSPPISCYNLDRSPSSQVLAPTPYKGLSAFNEQDAKWFFGRERLIQQLLERFWKLKNGEDPASALPRLLPVLGPSGSGKSSVVRAGLIPRLTKRTPGAMQRVRVAVFTPELSPIISLATMLARIFTNQPNPHAAASKIVDILKRPNAQGEWNGLNRVASRLPDINSFPLLIIIDQFEEVYSLCKEPEESQQFIENVLHAATDRAGYVSVILTLRTDFLGQTQSHPGLNHSIAENAVFVTVMDETELTEAIAKPAKLAGIPLDDSIVNVLVKQVEGREGALPLLQFALSRIWEGMTEGIPPIETLREIRGVGGALAGEAQRLYETLSDDDKTIARRAFLNLVHLGEGALDTRRRILIDDIIAHGEKPDYVYAVLAVFADPKARLITLSADGNGRMTAEVTHEALFEHWETLKNWLNDSRDDLRFQRRLAEAVTHWEQQKRADGLLWRPPDLDLLRDFQTRAGQDMTVAQVDFFHTSLRRERMSIRLKRIAVATLVALTVLTSVAAYFAIQSRNAARKAEQEAQQRVLIGKSRQLAAQAQAAILDYPQRSLLLAVEALNVTLKQGKPRVLEAEQALRDALANIGGIGLGQAVSVTISPDSHWLLTGHSDGRVQGYSLIDFVPSMPSFVLQGHKGDVSTIVVSPDNHWVITSGEDETLRLWDITALESGSTFFILRGYEGSIKNIVVSSDSRWLIVGSDDGTATVWDLTVPDLTTPSFILNHHGSGIAHVKISPDNNTVITVTQTGQMRKWDLTASDPVTSSRIIFRGFENVGHFLALSPNNRWLFNGYISGSISGHLVDLTSSDSINSITDLEGHIDGIHSVTFSADSHWLITGGDNYDKTIRLWDMTATEPAKTAIVLRGHTGLIESIAITPDNHWLITGSSDVRAWDLSRSDPTESPIVLRGHDEQLGTSDVTVSPDSKWLITRDDDNFVRLWQLDFLPEIAESSFVLGASPFVLNRPLCESPWISTSPDNRWVLAESCDLNSLLMWDLHSPDLTTPTLSLNHNGGSDFWMSPDNRWLVTINRDDIVQLWKLSNDAPTATPYTLRHRENSSRSPSFSPDSRWLAMEGERNTVLLWDLTTFNLPPSPIILHGHEGRISDLSISPDSRWVIMGSSDGTARLWDLTASDPSTSFLIFPHGEGLVNATISPDNRWLLTSSTSGNKNIMKLWDLTNPRPTARFFDWQGEDRIYIDYPLFSPDGHWLVTSSSSYDNGKNWLWDLRAPGPLKSVVALKGHTFGITDVTFSPDSRRLVTGSRDTTVRAWDLTAPDPATSSVLLRGNLGIVNNVTISSNNRWLITGGVHELRLWDLTESEPEKNSIVLHSDEWGYYCVGISPDDRWAITYSDRGNIKLFPLQLDELTALACRTAGRNLSYTEYLQYFREEEYPITCSELPHLYSVLGSVNNAAEEGYIDVASAMLRSLTKFDSILHIPAESWNTLCRQGSFSGAANKILNACEKAVALEPENIDIRDSRGLARSLTGDFNGAIEDFQFFMELTSNDEAKTRHQHWIEELEAGKNPFMPEILEDFISRKMVYGL